MSVNGLQQQYIPPTLDGLTVIDADEIYIDGQLIDLTNLVPYTGADKPINAGAQPIRTSYTAAASADVVNLSVLTNAVAFQDTANALTYLNKITTGAQTVAGPITFQSGLITSLDTTLASRVEVGPNYQSLLNAGSATTSNDFGSITNAGGTYQTTSTGSNPVLSLFTITLGQRASFSISFLVEDAVDTWTVDIYQSADNIYPYGGTLLGSLYYPTNSTVFQVFTTSITPSTTGYICARVTGTGSTVTLKWKDMATYSMGVALTNVSMPSQIADRVLVINDKKQVVASGINTTKLGYLDNVSSDIQTQLNNRLKLDGSNANQNIVIGAYKVQSSATPSTGNDYTNKTYVDSAITAGMGAYVLKTGDTMTGALTISVSGLSATTTEALKLTSSANHYDGNASESFVFSGPNGYMMLGRNKTRDATTANLLIGAPSTEVCEIVSTSSDGTTSLPLNQLGSVITLFGSDATYANRKANPSKAQVVIKGKTTSERLLLGTYYTTGVGACCGIQASDYYSNADHGQTLLINTLGGNVGIGSGVNGTYYDANCKFTINSDYSQGDTGGLCINASDDGSAANRYNLRVYPYVQLAGYVAYQFLTYNASTGYNSFKILSTGEVQIDKAILWANRGDCRIYNGSADAYSPTSTANNLIIKSWWGIGYESYDGVVRIAMDTRTGDAYFKGHVGIGTVPTYSLEVNGITRIYCSAWTDNLEIFNVNSSIDQGYSGIAFNHNNVRSSFIRSFFRTNNTTELRLTVMNASGSQVTPFRATVDGIGATQVYTDDWLRINNNYGGLYWQNLGWGITSPLQAGNTYGNVSTYATGFNGWCGWGIRGKLCFMQSSSSTTWGIHDNDYSWLIYGDGLSSRKVLIGGGVAQFSQTWDRCIMFANGVDYSGGYFYYNQGNSYGTISDRRIKKEFKRITVEQSCTFLNALEPTSFCLKEGQPPSKVKKADGTETEEDCGVVCSCRQDGWIAQNVLAACELSGASKSVINSWYDYEQELNLPEEERKTLIGVSDRPILSHTVNVVKALLSRIEVLEAREVMLEAHSREQEGTLKKMEERIEKMASLLSQLMNA